MSKTTRERGYYSDGSLSWETPYRNGKKEGVEKSYYPDGTLRWGFPYRNGKEEGVEKGYYLDGTLRWETPYRNGLRHGEAKDYEKGETMKSKWYLYGVPCTEEFFKQDFSKYPVEKALLEKNAQLRMAIITSIGIARIVKEAGAKVIEDINALDLYQKEKIGDYYQHGDVLIKPDPVDELGFDEIDDDIKERLKKINYRLLEIDIGSGRARYLQMNNASHFQSTHIEGVRDAKTVFEAICERNKERCLPFDVK